MKRKMNRFLRKTKNAILITLTAFAGIAFVISGCSLDSESNLPIIICSLCLLWISLFMFANSVFDFEYYEDEYEDR